MTSREWGGDRLENNVGYNIDRKQCLSVKGRGMENEKGNRVEPDFLRNMKEAGGIKRSIMNRLGWNCLCSPGGRLLIGGGIVGL